MAAAIVHSAKLVLGAPTRPGEENTMRKYKVKHRRSWAIAFSAATMLAVGLPAAQLKAAEVVTSGGALGMLLAPGLIDIDGDGTADVNFVSNGVSTGFLDATGSFGLVGNIGGVPGVGAAWVSSNSTLVPTDGIGRNEIVAEFRGAMFSSDDNWSKVHLSSGDGWVQWQFGATRSVVTPLAFVREGFEMDLSAEEAAALVPEPSLVLLQLSSLCVLLALRGRGQGSDRS